jgi:hypothetical protein
MRVFLGVKARTTTGDIRRWSKNSAHWNLAGSKITKAFLDCVNAGAVALMIALSLQLGRAGVVDVLASGIAALSAIISILLQINSAWLILPAL